MRQTLFFHLDLESSVELCFIFTWALDLLGDQILNKQSLLVRVCMARWTRTFASWSRSFEKMNSPNLPEIFLPPINRDMHVLDRLFFEKTIPLSAATVFQKQDLERVRKELVRSGDILSIDAIKITRDDETVPGQKCMLLKPPVDATGMPSSRAAVCIF